MSEVAGLGAVCRGCLAGDEATPPDHLLEDQAGVAGQVVGHGPHKRIPSSLLGGQTQVRGHTGERMAHCSVHTGYCLGWEMCHGVTPLRTTPTEDHTSCTKCDHYTAWASGQEMAHSLFGTGYIPYHTPSQHLRLGRGNPHMSAR